MEKKSLYFDSRSNIEATPAELKILKKYKKRNQLAELWRRLCKNKAAVLGMIIIVILLVLAVFANSIYDYEEVVIKADYGNSLQAPNVEHPFGTDEMGRDILARVLHGTRVSMKIAIVATAISFIIGGLLGAYSGFLGGVVDGVIMRIMDVFLAMPNMLLALTIVAAFGCNVTNLIIAIAISDIPLFARILRSSVLSIKDSEYVEAARAAGAGTNIIIFREILPNCLAPLIVQISIVMAAAIITAAALSFIGLGVQAPMPEWGSMLNSARSYMREYQYMTIFPGMAIAITVLAFNMLGDGLRDALDPRLKK